MIFEISFSPRSKQDLAAILDYLDAEWGASVSEKFLDKIDGLLDLISESPKIFSVVNKEKKIHKCVVNRNISLFYRIKNKEIELITFFHNKQHPSKQNL